MITKFEWNDKRKRAVKKWSFYAALIILPLIQWAIMYVYVNINSFLLAFRRFDPASETWSFVWFDNFVSLFNDPSMAGIWEYAIWNSLGAWGISVFVGITLQLLFAYYIFKKGPAGQFFRVVLFLPSILSATVLISIYKYYADVFISKIFNLTDSQGLGIISNNNTRFMSIMFFNVYMSFGVGVLMYTSAMTSISESVFDACKIDGVNALQEFFVIVLPQIVPTITVFIVTGIAGIFTNQINLFSFYQQRAIPKIQTVGYYLYIQIYNNGSNYQYYSQPAALGIMITLVTAPVVLFARWGMKKVNPMED
ncbi:MAG: sugar ABC transporter permease [Clostridia bacterium]|nr:sugar ABC transporter permease [Clostridia bacterium]